MICFDLPMPHEVFGLLNKEILGLTRFGIDTPGSVTITFSNLRRLSYLFDQFQDCDGLESKERQSWLSTPRRRKQWSIMLKIKFWEQIFFMDTGIRMGLVRISQQWIEDARLNHRVTSISLIPPWQKRVNLCAWTINKKTECLPWIIAIIPYFSQFFW